MPSSKNKRLNVEYSIFVEDIDNGNTASLTRKQLWNGLVLKLTNPQRFSDQVGGCHVQWINDKQFIREQQFPAFAVEDKVTLTPERKIQVYSLASVTGAFSLVIQLERHMERGLVLTYKYERSSADEDGLAVDDYLAAAYKQADETSILRMIELAESGEI